MLRNKPYNAKLAAPTKATARLIDEGGAITVTAGAVDGDKKGPPTFEGVAYSGGVVSRKTLSIKLDADYVIDLAGMSPGRGVKANLDHKSTQRVGHLTNVDNDKKQLKVTGALSAATAHRDEVANSAADGFGWDVSIEASLDKPKKLEAGKTASVNGRTISGPLYIFTKSNLTGLGFVSNGADAGNEITIAATAAGAKAMNEVETLAAELGIDLETATDAQKAKLQKMVDAEAKAGKTKTGGERKSFRDMAKEEREEIDRADRIAKMGRDAIRENPLYIDQIERATDDAIESKTGVDAFELELLRSTRMTAGRFTNHARGAQSAELVECALAMATGLPNIEKHYSEATLAAVDKNRMRNISIQQVLLNVASSNGYHVATGERIHVGNIRSVLEYCFPPVTARMQGWSTVSLPNVLGAVANKQILAGYMEEDSTWKEISRIKNVTNFYTQNHYRMLDDLEYEEVGAAGEIKHGKLKEETYTSQAKTYGKMLGITRQQIINDDLGAFDDIRERLGRGAATKFNNVFWAAFINNSSFFTTALTNYIEGSTTNLGTDGVGLGLGVKQFRKMTTSAADGTKRIGNGMSPKILLVPPELEQIADNLFKNNNAGAVASSSVNTFAGKYRPVVQSRLSEAAFTGFSTTAWFLFGDSLKPMVVSLLNGQASPTVESTDAEFNTLGIQFRGYHDFGADKAEYLAGLKSKGAA